MIDFQKLDTVAKRLEFIRIQLGFDLMQDFSAFIGFKNQSGYSQSLIRNRLSEIHLERLKSKKNVNPDFIKFGILPPIFERKTKIYEIDFTNVNQINIHVQRNQDLQPTKLLIEVEEF